MLRSFVRAGLEKGVVSAFFRLHPLLPFPLAPLGKFGRLVQHGRTVYIDLSLTPEQMWQETSNNHRRHIRHMQKNGFVVVRNEWRYLDAFIRAYRESMSRLEASQFYFFSDDYFEDLRKALGERLDLWTVLSPEGEVAAGGLFTVENGIVEYHLGANAQEFVLWSPLKLLISEVRFWAREAGHRLLHLGGGVGGDMDSLYTFKSRFSPLSADFHTFRAVLMPEVYDQLTLKRFGGEKRPDAEDKDFFPSYRTP
jgi:lipid II:glycine glycyltransferase (peptidoglycan interpeptide bridge formation enzyme)